MSRKMVVFLHLLMLVVISQADTAYLAGVEIQVVTVKQCRCTKSAP